VLEVLSDVMVEARGGVVMPPGALIGVGWVGMFPGHIGSLHDG
jgi:hypothetical protein